MRPFHYARADDLATALRTIPSNASRSPTSSSGQFIAGGTTMLDLMKLGVMAPQTLIDLNGLATTFGQIEIDEQGLHLGAFVHMAQAAEDARIRRDYPVIAASLRLAASQQLRLMATLGGNVLQRTRCSYFRDTRWTSCNKRSPGSGCAALEGNNRKHAILGTSAQCIASYPGDFAQALIALDAKVETASSGGKRSIPFEDLHRGPEQPDIETVLAPGEIIIGFTIPTTPWARRSAYVKVRDRESYEFGLATAAVALDLDGDMVREARIALGGVAYRPWRAREAEASLRGKRLDRGHAEHAAQVAFSGAVPRGDNRYKIELGQHTLVRTLLEVKAMPA
jgi:xanthine dehydrogenase YagS FAD-binding subunit